ncbi:MAG TPA: DMT family transporter [Steroidobacteraceae bacterium]|jgi:transporter family-2 protein|nr:DMT family transporter [Steroidobacteraceae bacterium]
MQGPLYYLLAFGAGLVLVLQVGMNSTLRGVLDSPLAAALISFLVGTLALALYMLVTRTPWPARAQLADVPGWAWYGGVLGAFYVATSVIVGPRLGAATLLSLIVLGQLLTSLLVDHFGWIGFPVHPLSLVRLAGAGLLFAGVLLITR